MDEFVKLNHWFNTRRFQRLLCNCCIFYCSTIIVCRIRWKYVTNFASLTIIINIVPYALRQETFIDPMMKKWPSRCRFEHNRRSFVLFIIFASSKILIIRRERKGAPKGNSMHSHLPARAVKIYTQPQLDANAHAESPIGVGRITRKNLRGDTYSSFTYTYSIRWLKGFAPRHRYKRGFLRECATPSCN